MVEEKKRTCKYENISVIGLGYVGLPIAVAFSKVVNVIGYDINEEKIHSYRSGQDPTDEVGTAAVLNSSILFTSDADQLKTADFHIVSVPTPIHDDTTPDLRPLIHACETLGKRLRKGTVVVFESTVYPGVTEEICIPILEQYSQLHCGSDFKVGYSPERINPGDKTHRLENIVKIVSGLDQETVEDVAAMYSLVVKAGVYRAESIKVAEAAKIIENSQRDINIAFMNELSIIFNKMNIDTRAVLAAAGTKWNFLNFSPGLVGGHCIGVDPYYLTYKANQLGYRSQVILAGRVINDNMGKYVAEATVKKMVKEGVSLQTAKVAILGLTFKENCGDARNTRVIDLIRELNDYNISLVVTDPLADRTVIQSEYGLDMESDFQYIQDMDCVVIAVAHKEYTNMTEEQLLNLYSKDSSKRKILIDVKGIRDREVCEQIGLSYWRL